MPKTKGLTLKQRKFLKFYLETGNASDSALKAGYKYRQSGSENLEKAVIQEAFQELLDQQGITDQKLSQVLDEGLVATKIQSCDIFIRDENGKLKVNKNSNDFIEIPDHATRHRYLETALKLKRHTQEKEEEGAGIEHQSIHIYLPKQDEPDSWKVNTTTKDRMATTPGASN